MSWRFGIPEGSNYPATVARNEGRKVLYTVSFKSDPEIRGGILWLVSLKRPAMSMQRRQKAEGKSSSTDSGKDKQNGDLEHEV
jgi:hypothetical protein